MFVSLITPWSMFWIDECRGFLRSSVAMVTRGEPGIPPVTITVSHSGARQAR